MSVVEANAQRLDDGRVRVTATVACKEYGESCPEFWLVQALWTSEGGNGGADAGDTDAGVKETRGHGMSSGPLQLEDGARTVVTVTSDHPITRDVPLTILVDIIGADEGNPLEIASP
jgi:hypothetical protein